MEKAYKKCTRCGEFYNSSEDFTNMAANGERLHSHLEVYGKKYDLCPKCTQQLWLFIENKDEVQTTKPINPNTIKLKAYKEMAKYLKGRKTFEMPKYNVPTVAPAVTFKVIDEFIEMKEEKFFDGN